MATIIIKQGDADTLTETITGLSSLAGYSAKMYIYSGTTVLATLTGVITSLTIVYSVVNESSKLWAVGNYRYETKIYDTSDHVYTPSTGMFVVTSTIEENPS